MKARMLVSIALLGLACAMEARAGESKLPSEGGAGGGFGTSIAAKGEFLAIGAPGDRGGSVHVYGTDGRYWRLTPDEPPILSSFGRSVALDGNVLAAGAPSEGKGAIYIFRFNGANWVQEFKAKTASTSWYSSFGTAIAVSGDRVLASAPTRTYDDRNEGTGFGTIYRYDGSNWVWETTLVTNANHDAFGRAVALEADTAVVAGNQKVRVYRRQASGWQLEAQMVNRGGWAVSLEGNLLLSSSPGDSTQGNGAGAVYLFTRTGSSWTESGRLLPPGRATGARFGTALAVRGELIAVGAPKYSQGPNEYENAGAAFVFRRQTGGWVLEASLFASDAKDNPRRDELATGLGSSAATVNGAVLAGAPQDDQNGSGAGAVYVFTEPWPVAPQGGRGGPPPGAGSPQM